MSSPEDRAAMKASKELEKQMKQDFNKERQKIKLLLLGAGESGKSTIFKQMRILFGAPLSEEEKVQITPVVYANTIASMKILVDETINMEYTNDVSEANKGHFELLQNISDKDKINTEIGTAIKELWKDPGIVLTWKRRVEFQIVESVKYYFNEIDRIMKDDYVPTQQDMLLARVRTSGIVTERYVIDKVPFEMYDVGGQRNERKKWIHCFDDVTAVIFVAALSEYDQVLFEDAGTNRMEEAINLFDEICNNKYFRKSSMILFLNKKDLFEEKIKVAHIKDQPQFSDFSEEFGSENYYEAGTKYFLDKFLQMNKTEDRAMYNHATCATDSGNVKIVFGSCKDIIINQALDSMGV